MYKFFLLLIISFLNTKLYAAPDKTSVLDYLNNTGKHYILHSIIKNSDLKLVFENIDFTPRTIYAPTDEAFGKMSSKIKNILLNRNKKAIIKFIMMHIYSGNSLSRENNQTQNFKISLDGSVIFLNRNSDLFIKDIVVKGPPVKIRKTIIIPIDCFMYMQELLNATSNDIVGDEGYKYTSCCLQTNKEAEDFLSGL